MRRVTALLALGLLAAAFPATSGEIPEAVIVLEASIGLPGRVAAATPPRFVLLEDRQVFVGGSDLVYRGELEKDDVKPIERQIKQLRKRGLLAPSVSLGDDAGKRYRLRLLKDEALDMVITGDPDTAPATLEPLASFLKELLRFHHPSLHPFTPAGYAISARQGELVGGCRRWSFTVSLEEVLSGPRWVAASEAERWPSGANPSSVCAAGRRYVVSLRPLLPGERP